MRWTALACAAALLLAPLTVWPYGYYEILRLGVTAASIWVAVVAFRRQSMFWAMLGIGLSVLFNPVIPVHLTRAMWLPIDLICAALFAVAAFKLTGEKAHGQT